MDKILSLPLTYQEDIKKAIKILKENGAKEVYIFAILQIENLKIIQILILQLED